MMELISCIAASTYQAATSFTAEDLKGFIDMRYHQTNNVVVGSSVMTLQLLKKLAPNPREFYVQKVARSFVRQMPSEGYSYVHVRLEYMDESIRYHIVDQVKGICSKQGMAGRISEVCHNSVQRYTAFHLNVTI
jgi:hypothetical protein